MARSKAAAKPNIVVIWGDDIGITNLSCYSDGLMGYRTPNIDRIAQEGMRFTDCYAEQSCTAGRSSFITGQHGLRTGLTKVGLPAALAGAAGSTEFDDEIKRSHHEAFDVVGTDVGTPVIRVRGNAIFGPVITPIPRGEAAGQLWDGVVLVTEADGFFELKRTRDRKPTFD